MNHIRNIAFMLLCLGIVYVLYTARDRRLAEIEASSAMERDYYVFFVPAAEKGKVRCYVVAAENRYLALRYLEGRVKRRPEHKPFEVSKNDMYFIEK